MEPYSVNRGENCLVLAMPHTGTWLPQDVFDALNDRGQELSDTDWHINRLYEDLIPDITIVRANFHRYVIDANRDPSGQSLYPGQTTTDLCPTTDFDGQPIYREGREPGSAEVRRRQQTFHAPYHGAIAAELVRVKAKHGVAVLYDCHSIRSRIPFLFDDVLPDFNIGTNQGVTCAVSMQNEVERICAAAKSYSSILNGRFKGGWTTRHYGQPGTGVHAIQMELAQSVYLETEAAPFAFDAAKAVLLRPHLRAILETLITLAKAERCARKA